MSEPHDLVVLAWATAAMAMAALGALPYAVGRMPSRRTLGGAQALAGGAMLGVGYLLTREALAGGTGWAVLGAGLGGIYTALVQRGAGTEQLDLDSDRPATFEQGVGAVVQSTLHGASEGVAIGVAMARDLRLGIFLAIALGLHNVAEGMALTAALRRRGIAVSAAAALCVVTDATQPLFAVFAFALVSASPASTATIALGFAAGSLGYLVLTEPVPDAYRRASRLAVAVTLAGTTAMVVLLEALWRS